jgi:hypothetical protein
VTKPIIAETKNILASSNVLNKTEPKIALAGVVEVELLSLPAAVRDGAFDVASVVLERDTATTL